MENKTMPLVGRFAPTPSGRMHLGNVFAALLAWLSVRSRDGEMVLRMENLDTQRTSPEFAKTLREDLTWLGLTWDRETPAQSTRSQIYDACFDRLSEMGLFGAIVGKAIYTGAVSLEDALECAKEARA